MPKAHWPIWPHEVFFGLNKVRYTKLTLIPACLAEGRARQTQDLTALQLPGEDFEHFADFLIMLRSKASAADRSLIGTAELTLNLSA